ncbi:hypothetical protein N7G274_000996 [Stereocaulon virgatum]|uniref:Uncharacterized protein n=1 Tax=Stereocaulon virgatum TaxID=373712 RepID=A0ABR4AMK1_9LECA
MCASPPGRLQETLVKRTDPPHIISLLTTEKSTVAHVSKRLHEIVNPLLIEDIYDPSIPLLLRTVLRSDTLAKYIHRIMFDERDGIEIIGRGVCKLSHKHLSDLLTVMEDLELHRSITWIKPLITEDYWSQMLVEDQVIASYAKEEILGKLLAVTSGLKYLEYYYMCEIFPDDVDPSQYLDCAALEVALRHVKMTLECLHIAVQFYSWVDTWAMEPAPTFGIKGTLQSLGTSEKIVDLEAPHALL